MLNAAIKQNRSRAAQEEAGYGSSGPRFWAFFCRHLSRRDPGRRALQGFSTAAPSTPPPHHSATFGQLPFNFSRSPDYPFSNPGTFSRFTLIQLEILV
ncbi:hypothetical protein J6590_032865 [Homalodisca vitripennis]|nr:hypothetical protein J6590_032865 [Homalodisca vitripennis]